MENPNTYTWAIFARWGRTLLWPAALLIATVAYSQPTGRLSPPTAELVPLGQEADSLVWGLTWEPGIIRGSPPTGFEAQADVDDDATGFEGDHLDLSAATGPDGRSWEFRTLRTCGDTLWVHARVRAVGSWTVQGESVTATPWSVVTAVWAPPCADLPPGAPEPSLDTVAADTTGLDLAVLGLECVLQPAGHWADRGFPDLPASPEIHLQADLRTVSGTGETWGSRQTLLRGDVPVAEVELQHGGWQDSARYVRIGAGFTLQELEPGPDYAVRWELDADDQVEEPAGNNTRTAACPQLS